MNQKVCGNTASYVNGLWYGIIAIGCVAFVHIHWKRLHHGTFQVVPELLEWRCVQAVWHNVSFRAESLTLSSCAGWGKVPEKCCSHWREFIEIMLLKNSCVWLVELFQRRARVAGTRASQWETFNFCESWNHFKGEEGGCMPSSGEPLLRLQIKWVSRMGQ
jgi:hypothetical protein